MESLTGSGGFASLVTQEVRTATGADAAAAPAAGCLHCGLPTAGPRERFCCSGCEAVYSLLHDQGLARYYELGGRDGVAVAALPARGRDHKWIEPLEARLAGAPSCRVQLGVQGIHCSACVWLIEELFRRQPGALRAVVNPARGEIDVAVDPAFPLRRFVEQVERVGYVMGPASERPPHTSDGLLARTGIAIALALNAMIFAAAIYFGLDEGPVYRLLSNLLYGIAALSVLVGGSYFLRAAWQSVRRRVLHLDVPIAVGIVLAFTGSTWSFFMHEGRAAYLDTLTVFIALMLLGRLLQRRAVERNRDRLLRDPGVGALLTRRLRDGRPELIACGDVAHGDVLLIAPGDLVPTEARLLEDEGSFSLDWITGESAHRAFTTGEAVPAGAFNVGNRAYRVETTGPFSRSQLLSLLRAPADGEQEDRWWGRLSRVYVVGVLGIAAVSLTGWLLATGDTVRSLEVTTAVLVVTCPCAFGIATPLAYELVHSALARLGLFVRRAGLLDRALRVRRVVFDKTGTLTTGALELADEPALDRLSDADRNDLYDLVARSAHPKSLAVKRALDRRGAALRQGVVVEEHAGRGLSAEIDGRRLRFGSAAHAAPGTEGDLVFSVDGETRAVLATREHARQDAVDEIRRLTDDGCDVFILSGDAQDKVGALAARLGVPADHAVGDHDPERKAEWLAARDRGDTLFIGDGINDALAAQAAGCSGTPAIDRPFMAARTDFYFVTAGLAPILQMLRASRRLAEVVRRNLAFALAYNAVAVGVAAAGFMQPWLAAVLMPVSALTSLAMTTVALGGRQSWKS